MRGLRELETATHFALQPDGLWEPVQASTQDCKGYDAAGKPRSQVPSRYCRIEDVPTADVRPRILSQVRCCLAPFDDIL
jgi:hypothetical protein